MIGTISQATSNNAVLIDSRSNDFIISTSTLKQRILMGFSSNFPSSISLGKSNLVIGSENSNVDINHFGNTSNYGNFNISKDLITSNAFIDYTVGIGARNFDSNLKLYVAGDTRIEGDLIVNGNIESIDTNITVTDEFQVINLGTGPALYVNQLGATPVMTLESSSNTVLKVTHEGNVAIGSNNPTERLDVQGNMVLRGNLMLSNIIGSNATFNNLRVYSNADIDRQLTVPDGFLTNLYMGNKLIIDNTGIITNSNYIPTLDTGKIQYGTFTSNFIENYNIISNKLASNLTISGTTFFSGVVGIDTSNPSYAIPSVKLRIEGGDTLVTGQNSFASIGDQARMYLGNSAHFIGATCNVGIVMQVPNTSYPFVLETNSGYLGLGTMDPEERLHVANNAKINNNAYILNKVAISHSNPIETLDIAGNMSLSNYGKIVISTSNNNLGVNISNPTAKLHVNYAGDGDIFLIEDSTNPDNTPFIIKDDGKVGFGYTNPTELADINGNVKIGSNLYITRKLAINNSNPLYDADIQGNVRLARDLYIDGNVSKGGSIHLYGKNKGGGSNGEWLLENMPYSNLDFLRISKYDASQTINNDNTMLFSDQGYVRLGGHVIPDERLHVSHGHVKIDSNLYIMGRTGLATSNPSERFEIGQGNAKFGSNVYILSRLGIGTSNPGYDLDVLGDINLTGVLKQGSGNAIFGANLSVMNYVGIGTSNPTEALQITNGNADLSSNLYVENRIGVTTKLPSERIDVANGNIKVSSNIYVMNKVGVRTSNPQVIMELKGTDALLIPIGTIAERPTIPELGHIRYNMDYSTFEGFGAGNAWGSLGGVKDVNQDTYISAEAFPTSNDDILKFYTSNNEVMRIMTSGRIGISNQSPSERLELSGGNAKFNSNIYIRNRLFIGTGSNPTESLDITGNFKVSSNIYIFSKLGVGTSNPSTSIEINSTDAMLIPKGTTVQRPGIPIQGHIRYNTSTSTFEGFGAGNTWGSLGGVKDTNLDTYISAESFPTSNDDILRFFTSNNEIMRIMPNGRVGISNQAPSERLELNGGNAKFNSNIYILQRQAISHSNPTESLDIQGNIKVSSNIYLYSRLGISTSNPAVSLEVIGTDAILIPKGTILERPQTPLLGHIRYNTNYSTFEGFGAGNAWGSLGGVKDVNQDTYISAESFPTSNDDILKFYTSNNEVMRIMTSGRIGISNQSPSERLELNGGNAKFNSNIYIQSRIGVGLSNPQQSIHTIGNVRASNGTLGPVMMLIPPIAYTDVFNEERLILDNSLEAGNDIADPTWRSLFYGSGYLYQDMSDDNMVWKEARLIFRGVALTNIDPEYTSMVVQDFLHNRSPQYSNISPSFTIMSQSQQRGYVTSSTPWFPMSTNDVRHLAIYVNSSSNNSQYRFGSVYIQYR